MSLLISLSLSISLFLSHSHSPSFSPISLSLFFFSLSSALTSTSFPFSFNFHPTLQGQVQGWWQLGQCPDGTPFCPQIKILSPRQLPGGEISEVSTLLSFPRPSAFFTKTTLILKKYCQMLYKDLKIKQFNVISRDILTFQCNFSLKCSKSSWCKIYVYSLYTKGLGWVWEMGLQVSVKCLQCSGKRQNI